MAEAFEGTNTTTDGALRLASVEIARTEFLVGGSSSDESVGNDQDFVPDGHHCSLVAAVAHDAAVARAESCIPGARGGLTCLDQPLVALASLAALSLARTLVVARTHPAPARQMARRGETTHVDADLGDDHFRRSLLNARNGLQALDDLRERVQQLLDLVTAFLDGLVEVVQVSQDAPNQKPVVAPDPS